MRVLTPRAGLLASMVLAGFAAMIWAYVGTSGERIVAQQMPWVASGGLTGAALIVVGATLAALHRRRRNVAAEIDALEVATREATEVALLLRARKQAP